MVDKNKQKIIKINSFNDKYNKGCFAKVSTRILFVSTFYSGPISILLNPIR